MSRTRPRYAACVLLLGLSAVVITACSERPAGSSLRQVEAGQPFLGEQDSEVREEAAASGESPAGEAPAGGQAEVPGEAGPGQAETNPDADGSEDPPEPPDDDPPLLLDDDPPLLLDDDPPLLLDDDPPLLLDDEGEEPHEAAKPIADNSRCHHCHLNYVDEKIAVIHAKANIGCADCHGKCDAHIADESWASGGNGTPPELMYRREDVNSFCFRCHPNDKIPELEHKSFLAGTAKEKHCTDCHGDHRLTERKCKWK